MVEHVRMTTPIYSVGKSRKRRFMVYYTAPIINRQSEGVVIKDGLEYLKTNVAIYELRTPGHMMCTVYLYHCHPILLKIYGIFELFAYFSENKLPRVLKKVDITTQVGKIDKESF